MKTSSRALIAAVFLCWSVFLAYLCLRHPHQLFTVLLIPFPENVFQDYTGRLSLILYAVFFLIVFVPAVSWLGQWIIDQFVKSEEGFASGEKTLIGFGIATIVIGYFTLFLGWPLDALYRGIFWIVYVLLLAGMCSWYRPRRSELTAWLSKRPGFDTLSFWQKGFWLLLIVSAVLLCLYAQTPPLQSDAIRYHLAAPQEYLKRNAIEPLPLNAFTNFPFLAEMLFMFVMAGLPDISAKLLHLVFFLANLSLLYFFWRNLLRDEPGDEKATAFDYLPVFIFLTTPVAFIISGWGFIDHVTAFYFLLMLYCLGRWRSARETVLWLVLGGLFGGAAASTKYTMIPQVILAALYVLTVILFDRREEHVVARCFGRAVGKGALFGFIALTVFSPWMIKNWQFTGNPVYPLANDIFQSPEWSPENQEFYESVSRQKGALVPYLNALRNGEYLQALRYILWSPIDITIRFERYEYHFLGLIYALSIPLLLMLLARSWGNAPPLATTRLLFLFLAGYWVIWFHVYQSNRFLVPLLPVLALLITKALENWRERWPAFSKACLAVFIIASMYQFIWSAHWIVARARTNPVAVALGFETRDRYLARELNYYPMTHMMSNIVEEGERVLFVGEHRTYHFDEVSYWASDWFDTPVILWLIRRTPDNEALFEYLWKNDFRYVFFNLDELNLYREQFFRPRFSDAEWRRFVDFVQSPKLARVRQATPGIYLSRIELERGEDEGRINPALDFEIQ